MFVGNGLIRKRVCGVCWEWPNNKEGVVFVGNGLIRKRVWCLVGMA